MTAFAIGNADAVKPTGKKPAPEPIQITTFVLRAGITADKPFHEPPQKTWETESPWVIVARRAANLPDPPTPSNLRRPTKQAKPHTQSPPKEDKRLILRMGQEHEWRRLSPVTIKKIVTEKAWVAPSAVLAMTQVRSGLAIECASEALRETLLRVRPSLQMDEITIEPASDWTSHSSACTTLYSNIRG